MACYDGEELLFVCIFFCIFFLIGFLCKAGMWSRIPLAPNIRYMASPTINWFFRITHNRFHWGFLPAVSLNFGWQWSYTLGDAFTLNKLNVTGIVYSCISPEILGF